MPKPKKFNFPIIIRRVVGHSMLPVLPPGTTIIALGWFKQPKLKSVVIFEHEGKEKVKRVQDIQDNEIFVVGDHDTSSTDSRQFGWIGVNNIKARVIWPRTKKLD